ncbi:anti-sigma factor domain-containing protein, partial [Aeromicrobium sp.]|uniref:anti-sigma factor n=1 Tax=Aeromicrobium sp. TaxID=1871063 RepID=UPI003C624AD4
VAMAASTPQEHPVVTSLAQRSRIRRVAPRLALVAAVAAAVLGIGGFVAEHQRADELSADRSHMVAVMSAEDARTTVGKAAGGGTVRVIASSDKDAAVLVGTALSNLDADRTYQVWRMHDGRPTSVGLMGRGSGVMYVDGIKGADAFAVTVEPSGGSPKPTSEPIVATPV